MANHIEEGARNASYVSPKIQNEIISICNKLILEKLIVRIKKAEIFSVMCDETTDISTVEQMSLCVRIFDEKNFCVEDLFLQFIELSDVTGRGLAKTILETLTAMNLDISKIRGQGYDGAAAMSGRLNGVQAIIRETVPTAIFVHCSSHTLSLAIADSCNNVSIRNSISVVKQVSNFFNTPKRQNVLSAFLQDSKKQKLINFCQTRWTEKHRSISAYIELQDSVIDALDEISNTWTDSDSSSQAHLLLKAILNVEFQTGIHTLSKLFGYTQSLTGYLQTENIDLREAVNHVQYCSDEIKVLRSNTDKEFTEIYAKITSIAERNNFSLEMPRRAKTSFYRSNVPAESVEDYYKRSVFIPFIDHFSAQLDLRFINHKNTFSGFSCLIKFNEIDSTIDEECFKNLIQTYTDDIQDISESALILEYRLWKRKILTCGLTNSSVFDLIKICHSLLFPNIYKLLKILATLPVTTCSSERSFSTLKRLKTYLRNSTGQNRLNGLALLNIYRDYTPTADEVLNEMSKTQRRIDISL